MKQETELVTDGMISNAFAFTFEKGEHKGESYLVYMQVTCSSPTCPCGDVGFFVESVSKKNSKKEYRFYLDVIKRKISDTTRKNQSSIEYNFAKSFIADLKDENWKQFYSFFYAYKSQLTEKMDNIDELKIDFSHTLYDIEQNSTMTAYKEIFPFCKDLFMDFQDKKYLIDDQYCLSSICSCKQTALTFIEFEGTKVVERPSDYAIFYNYSKKQWESDVFSNEKTPGNKDIIDAMKKQIPDIDSTLKSRHKTLRRVYANFTENQENEIQTYFNKKSKVGRNEPCPCGSGKKYKKCCGR